jgi:hypothetical protein
MDDAAFTWDAYLDWLAATRGSLAAAADRLAAESGHRLDVGSVERALRRLRGRGAESGGTWGARALRVFGLPGAILARLRFLGTYHSRFTDLPVPVCEDLVRAWDRPPTTDSAVARTWLALARVTLAMRTHHDEAARERLAAMAMHAGLPPEAVIEHALAAGHVASRKDPDEVPRWLAVTEACLPEVADPIERACLFARWIDHRAYELNKGRGRPPDPAAAEALYLQIPGDGPPFALARRDNGLAYARWKLGRADEAADDARSAARHAGDGGHVRLRAMALSMLARIAPAEADAHDRAVAIARRLDDDLLSWRFRPRE